VDTTLNEHIQSSPANKKWVAAPKTQDTVVQGNAPLIHHGWSLNTSKSKWANGYQ